MGWFDDNNPSTKIPDPAGIIQGVGDDRLSYDDARAALKKALDLYGQPSDDASLNSLMNAQNIHAGGEVSAQYLQAIFQNLYNNAKAQYGEGGGGGTGAPTSSGGGGTIDLGGGLTLSQSDKDQIDKMLADVQSTDDPNYWYKLAAQHGGVASTGVDWLNDRIRRGDGSILVKNGTLQPFQDAPAGNSYASVVGTYTTPDRPANLQTFTPEQWTDQYAPPTAADLQKDPGYLASQDAIQRGLTNAAAAKGSAFNADFTARTLSNALDQGAATAYENLNNRAFQSYQQRYNQFLNTNNTNAAAFQMNENTYNADVANSLNQYLTRYGAYQDLIKNNLSYANLGLNATAAGNPGSTGSGQ